MDDAYASKTHACTIYTSIPLHVELKVVFFYSATFIRSLYSLVTLHRLRAASEPKQCIL